MDEPVADSGKGQQEDFKNGDIVVRFRHSI